MTLDGRRLAAIGVGLLAVAIVAGANAHLVAVAYSSQPACALPPAEEGAAPYRAAKPSC